MGRGRGYRGNLYLLLNFAVTLKLVLKNGLNNNTKNLYRCKKTVIGSRNWNYVFIFFFVIWGIFHNNTHQLKKKKTVLKINRQSRCLTMREGLVPRAAPTLPKRQGHWLNKWKREPVTPEADQGSLNLNSEQAGIQKFICTEYRSEFIRTQERHWWKSQPVDGISDIYVLPVNI